MASGEILTATAIAREAAEISILDARKFHFPIDEALNSANHILKAAAHRIRGIRKINCPPACTGS
jgi:hypothetical protein